MSSDRDLALYRRFGALNARNLLYLQSELMTLENRLKKLDESANDISKGAEAWSSPRSWFYLEKQGGEHLDVVKEIREKLEKYSESSHFWSRPHSILGHVSKYHSADVSKIQHFHHTPGYSVSRSPQGDQ